MQTKVLWIDVETTGLDPKANDIHQLAMIVEVGGLIMSEKEWKVRPHKPSNVDPKALEVAGVTLEDILDYPYPDTIHQEVIKLLSRYCDKYDRNDKFHLAGYNVHFDQAFFSEWFRKCGDQYYGSWVNGRLLDPYPLAQLLEYRSGKKEPTLKLEPMCKRFHVALAKAHDALEDLRATRRLFQVMLDRYIVVEEDRNKWVSVVHSPELRELLADYAHKAWSGWMDYMLPRLEDPECRARWDRQRIMPYRDLTEREKDSDRKEALRILDIIVAAMKGELS